MQANAPNLDILHAPPPTFPSAPGQTSTSAQASIQHGPDHSTGSPAPGTESNDSLPAPPSGLPINPLLTNPEAHANYAQNAVGLSSPGSAAPSIPPGASPAQGLGKGAPEPNKKALYVGGLDPRVSEEILKQIFETAGHVHNVKIIPDKNVGAIKGFNYGFIEYEDPEAAERAMQTMNGRRVHETEIRVNWAYQSTNTTKEDTSNHFHIFVGDLSNEVNDDILQQAFSAFGSVSEARVMWDMKTGRSRGYGFVAYRDRAEAEKALTSMDGEWLGSRAIRCNWANQKGQPSVVSQQHMPSMGISPNLPHGGAVGLGAAGAGYQSQYGRQGMQSYEVVVNQTPRWQTTCYVGNLTPYTTQNDLVPLFQAYGFVIETRFQSDRGFAFVKMDTHEGAAMAICQLSGVPVNGRPLKCSWGKDRPPTGQFDPYSSHTPHPATAANPYGAQQPAQYPYSQYPGAGHALSSAMAGIRTQQPFGTYQSNQAAAPPMRGTYGSAYSANTYGSAPPDPHYGSSQYGR